MQFSPSLLHFQGSESQTPDKSKAEDVMEAAMKTQGEREDIESKTEYGEEPEMTADSGDDTSVNGGWAKNMEVIDDVSFQWKEERDTQDNKEPTAKNALSRPEDVLRRLNLAKQNPNRNKYSRMTNETGKNGNGSLKTKEKKISTEFDTHPA